MNNNLARFMAGVDSDCPVTQAVMGKVMKTAGYDSLNSQQQARLFMDMMLTVYVQAKQALSK